MTKYIVKLKVERFKRYYTFFGFFKYGEWEDINYEKQVVFNSHSTFRNRMVGWCKENAKTKNTPESKIKNDQYRYIIYRIEEVEVKHTFDQTDIDKIIK